MRQQRKPYRSKVECPNLFGQITTGGTCNSTKTRCEEKNDPSLIHGEKRIEFNRYKEEQKNGKEERERTSRGEGYYA